MSMTGGLSDDDDVDFLIDAWATLMPEVDFSPLDVLSRLRRVAGALKHVRHDAFAVAGLTVWEFDVLAALRRSGPGHPLSPAELIARTDISSPAMTHRLNRLVERGLITRRRNLEDARGVLVDLSRAGTDRVDTAMKELVRREATLIGGLSPGEVGALVRTLRQLDRALQRYDATGGQPDEPGL